MFFQNANYSRVSADSYIPHKLQWFFEKHKRRKGYFTRRRIRFAYVYERYKDIPTVGTTEFFFNANPLCQNHRFFFFRKQLGPHQGPSPIQQPFQNFPPNPDGDLLPQKVPAEGDRFRDRVWRLRTRCNRQYVENYVQGKSRKNKLFLQKCAPSCTRSKVFWIRGWKGGTLCTLLNMQAKKTLSCQRYIYRNFCNI